jgi:hypothetical protein
MFSNTAVQRELSSEKLKVFDRASCDNLQNIFLLGVNPELNLSISGFIYSPQQTLQKQGPAFNKFTTWTYLRIVCRFFFKPTNKFIQKSRRSKHHLSLPVIDDCVVDIPSWPSNSHGPPSHLPSTKRPVIFSPPRSPKPRPLQ